MVFRRGVALVCLAAVVAMAGVSDVEAKGMTQEHHHKHKHHHHQVKETAEEAREYPNGSVRISTSDDGKKDADDKSKKVVTGGKKQAGADDSSDDSSEDKKTKKERKKERKSHKKKDKKDKKKGKKKEKKAQEDVVEKVAENGEITRTYAHGSVRIFTNDNASAKTDGKAKEAVATVDDKQDAHLHKKVTTTVKEIHVKKDGHGKHGKIVTGEVTKDLVLDEGENTIDIDGVNLKVTLKDNQVSVDVAGQHIEPGKDVTVKVPNHQKSAPAESPKKVAVEEKVTKKQDAAAAPQQAVMDAKKKQEIDAKADRVTELATKLSSTHTSFFQSETAPVVFICGIIGALAAVVGIAAFAVERARDGAVADGDSNIQSVLDESNDVDVEAGAAEDVEEADAFDDSESDNDDEEAGEFVNSHAEVAV